MIDGNKLGEVGFQKLGTPYSQMDCQAFVEWCLKQCGCNMDLAGSNAWFREVYKNGLILTPDACVAQYGTVPKGAFLFILEMDGREPDKYKSDGLGNASHIGICTEPMGKGAIHSSKTAGGVAESNFRNKTINGGWNRVGLWDKVSYAMKQPIQQPTQQPTQQAFPTLRKGDRGEYVTLAQTKLLQLGYDLGSYGADGDFGNRTEIAVKQFQYDHKLKADGIIGQLTWNALNEPTENILYTVTIPHLTHSKAAALISQYAGASMIDERG